MSNDEATQDANQKEMASKAHADVHQELQGRPLRLMQRRD
jgi:hypothetical protein